MRTVRAAECATGRTRGADLDASQQLATRCISLDIAATGRGDPEVTLAIHGHAIGNAGLERDEGAPIGDLSSVDIEIEGIYRPSKGVNEVKRRFVGTPIQAVGERHAWQHRLHGAIWIDAIQSASARTEVAGQCSRPEPPA